MCDAVLGAFTWNGPYALLRIELDPIGTKYLVATLAGKEQQFDGGAERRSLFVENIPEDSDILVGKDAITSLRGWGTASIANGLPRQSIEAGSEGRRGGEGGGMK